MFLGNTTHPTDPPWGEPAFNAVNRGSRKKHNMARFDSGARLDSGLRLDSPTAPPARMAQNLISAVMTDAQKAALIADLDAFATKWAPYKIPLSTQQIVGLSKIVPEDLALLELAAAFAEQNAASLPSDIGLDELNKDIALARQENEVLTRMEQEHGAVRGSMIGVLSDGFVKAREIYRITKTRGRTPANAEFLDRFGARFKGGGGTAPSPTPPGP
jgi:hypothetical protein